jgi:GT2 family glycosyltransferase
MVKAERGGTAARNKNVIIRDFLKGDYTHLFFLNNDTWPDEGGIKELIACDKDIVSGLTPAFNKGFIWMGQIEKDVQIKLENKPAQLTPAARAGGPAMLIKRKVLDTMEFPWFDFEQVEPGAEKSEDYVFCDKAIELGFEVWIEPGVVCHHNHNGMDILTMAKAVKCNA